MAISIGQTAYEVLEPGEYPATVTGIEAADGQFGPQLKWQFLTDDGHKLSAWTSQTFSPKSKLFKWTSAALGGWDIPIGYDFNSDHVVNRHVRLIVETKAGAEGDFSRVTGVLPPRKAQPPAGNGARQAVTPPPVQPPASSTNGATQQPPTLPPAMPQPVAPGYAGEDPTAEWPDWVDEMAPF